MSCTSVPSISQKLQNNTKTLQTVEGTTPSLELIDQWFQNQSSIRITTDSTVFNSKEIKSIQGRIQSIGPFVSKQDADALIWIEGHQFGVYVRDITNFKAEAIVPLKTEEDVFLISGEEKFIVNRKLLQEKIPYFQSIIVELQESAHDEIDLSLMLSPNQLKLILQYFDGTLQIDSSLKASDAVDLFMAAEFLYIEEIKESVRKQVPVINQIFHLLDEGLTELTLECRKNSFDRGSGAQPSLGMDGIVGILKLADSLGIRIETLSIFNVEDEDLPLLVEYLRGNTQIKSLSIRNRNLTDKSAPLLGSLIQELPSLRELEISHNQLGDKSFRSIATALESHTALEKVDLSCNRCSSKEFDELTEKLALNQTLKSLNLTACGIGHKLQNDGRYVRALSKNTSLQHLYLGNNCIYDSGAEGLATVVKENSHLKTIDLWGNRITLAGRERLKEALTANSSLTNVTINNLESEEKHDYRPLTLRNSEFDKIIHVLDQTPGNKLHEELQKNHLTTKIVLNQLATYLRKTSNTLDPSILGKALSLITESKEEKEYALKFMIALNPYLMVKSEFLKMIRECIVLNEWIATKILDNVLDGYSQIEVGPSDLKKFYDFTVLSGASSEKLLNLVFSRIALLIKRKQEDAAIDYISNFPEFIKQDTRDKAGRNFLLLAIQNNCPEVVDYLLKNDANYCAKDNFDANIADYAIAYKMYDVLNRFAPDSEIKEAKWLAHVWNLDGTRTLGKVHAKYTGFLGKESATRIARSALSYLYHWQNTQSERSKESHPLKKMNFKLMEQALLRLRRKEETLTPIQSHMPTFVKAFWDEHSAYVFFGRKQRILKCNRGFECGVPGVRIYKSLNNSDDLLEFAHKQLNTVNKYMSSTSFDQDLRLTHSNDVVQKEQPIENCASESGKSAIYALFIDEALETYPDEKTALEKAKLVYKDYTVFMRMQALENYLARKKSKHYDISLLNRIKEKTIDLEKRKDLWKGQTANVLALFKENNITTI